MGTNSSRRSRPTNARLRKRRKLQLSTSPNTARSRLSLKTPRSALTWLRTPWPNCVPRTAAPFPSPAQLLTMVELVVVQVECQSKSPKQHAKLPHPKRFRTIRSGSLNHADSKEEENIIYKKS